MRTNPPSRRSASSAVVASSSLVFADAHAQPRASSPPPRNGSAPPFQRLQAQIDALSGDLDALSARVSAELEALAAQVDELEAELAHRVDPPLLVDGEGELIGPFSRSITGQPLVWLRDAFARPVWLVVPSATRLIGEIQAEFPSRDCTGPPYLNGPGPGGPETRPADFFAQTFVTDDGMVYAPPLGSVAPVTFAARSRHAFGECGVSPGSPAQAHLPLELLGPLPAFATPFGPR